MSTILDFIRTIKFDEYDLTPPKLYDAKYALNSVLEDKDHVRIRNLNVVSENIKNTIKGYMDYHIAIVDEGNFLVIGFNKKYIYIYDYVSLNQPATMFSLDELKNDDLYLILRYGYILKKEFNI